MKKNNNLDINKFRRLITFFEICGKLKGIKRSGWIEKANVRFPESVADHSYRCAVIAMCISDLKKIKAEKIIKMILLHDLHEAIIGDLNHQKKQKIGIEKIQKKENEAISVILKHLPRKLRTEYRQLWYEFEKKESFEAKIAKQIDKLELAIQAFEYMQEGYNKKKLKGFHQNLENDFIDKQIKTLFKIIQEKLDN